jgi:hypothetical protein
MTLLYSLLLAIALSNTAQGPEKTLATLSIDQLHDFDEHSCTPARVDWIDAAIQTNATSISTSITAKDIDASIPRAFSFGCVNKTAAAIVVIHTFSQDEPDDYLVIPKGWVLLITPLQLAPAPAPAPEPDKPGIQLSQK